MTKIFDFHTHFGIAHNRKYLPKQVLSLFENKNLQGILCSSLSGIFDRETAEKELSFLLKRNQNIFGAYWVNPYLPNWQNFCDVFCKENKINCIKLSPTANIYQPTEKFMASVFDYCLQTNKIIVIHTDDYRSNPLQYVNLIKQYPQVKIVLYHLNTGLANLQVADMCENVFLETSFCERIMGLTTLKVAYKLLGPSRLVFGTDYPIVSVGKKEDFYGEFIKIYTRVFKARDLDKVLYKNAFDLLKNK